MTSALSFATVCLAKSSPDVASVSWLVVNLLCMAWSLHVAVYDIWTSSRKEDLVDESNTANSIIGDNDDNNIVPDMIYVSESGLATVEYLVWSLVTTIIWIVEVVLRTAFPPEITTISSPENGDEILKTPTDVSNVFENEFRIAQVQQHQQSIEKEAKENFNLGCVNCESTFQQQRLDPIQQRRRRRGILVVELLLAIFFFVESAFDCWNWKARIAEDDVFGEEVDIWISILGYLYMSYETYKAISRKRKHHATNVHWTAAPATTSPLSQGSTSYVNMTILGDDLHESTRGVMV
jgi:hypothetical protein